MSYTYFPLRRMLLSVCAILCLGTVPTRAQSERILDFHSEIRVQGDATVDVVETIRVHSAGDQIRHGIYRDFPTRYKDHLGNQYVVGMEVLGATRDGLPEQFRVEDRSNGKRIYLGRAAKFSSVLSAAQANGQNSGAYSPAWYSGSAWNNFGAGEFVNFLSGSFANAISSSSTAPGSSSGGGGGGGSGGGGGGGGGGVW